MQFSVFEPLAKSLFFFQTVEDGEVTCPEVFYFVFLFYLYRFLYYTALQLVDAEFEIYFTDPHFRDSHISGMTCFL